MAMGMTQTLWVLKYLSMHRKISQRIASEYGITRLASRINDLRKEGVDIETRLVTVNTRWNKGKTRVAEYYYKGVTE